MFSVTEVLTETQVPNFCWNLENINIYFLVADAQSDPDISKEHTEWCKVDVTYDL